MKYEIQVTHYDDICTAKTYVTVAFEQFIIIFLSSMDKLLTWMCLILIMSDVIHEATTLNARAKKKILNSTKPLLKLPSIAGIPYDIIRDPEKIFIIKTFGKLRNEEGFHSASSTSAKRLRHADTMRSIRSTTGKRQRTRYVHTYSLCSMIPYNWSQDLVDFVRELYELTLMCLIRCLSDNCASQRDWNNFTSETK